MFTLKTEVEFDSAHFLTDYYGKCENLHGHRYRVVVYINRDELQTEGTMKDMVLDFGVFKRKVRAFFEEYDHKFLVEEGSLADDTMACLEREGFCMIILPFRTTSENLARHFYEELRALDLPVCGIDVYETPMNCAMYRPEA